jgi:peptide/nickel transport system permease protein
MKPYARAKKIAAAWLAGLLLVAVFADFLANDQPLIASVNGEVRFPVLHDYGQSLGLVAPYQPTIRKWTSVKTDWAVWPPVPYAAGASDLANGGYKSPFAAQETGERARHYLGTDDLGRDVLAGLINGSRVAALIGLGAVLISLLLGIPLGGVAGFFGNSQLLGARYHWWGWSVGGPLGAVYAFVCLRPLLRLEGAGATLLLALAFVIGGLCLRWLLRLIPALRRRVAFPADTVVLQSIELFVNVPGLVLLIALLAIIKESSVALIAIIIGVLAWPTVARYLRGELLRIRSLPYIEAARVSGVNRWRILFHHALPNAVGPLLVVACFGFGAAVLSEAALSFLGLGIPADQVTWGSLLRASRSQPSAWWLAVFPGLLLTGTVLAGNLLGERGS